MARQVCIIGGGVIGLASAYALVRAGMTMDDLRNFRQLHSITPGHPEFRETPGVEATTGLGGAYKTANDLRDQTHGRIYRITPATAPSAADAALVSEVRSILASGVADATASAPAWNRMSRRVGCRAWVVSRLRVIPVSFLNAGNSGVCCMAGPDSLLSLGAPSGQGILRQILFPQQPMAHWHRICRGIARPWRCPPGR